MLNFHKLLELIIEQFEFSTIGKIVIFCLTITAIAVVVDTMLTHTFPAYTLIAIIIFIGALSMKIYENHQRNKNHFWGKDK